MDSNPFVLKLRQGANLTKQDEDALNRLINGRRRLQPRTDVVLEHSEPHVLSLILEGWGCRYKQLENGKRQIISFFLPGDLCQPYGILPNFMDHSLGALTSVVFATVSPKAVRELVATNPRIDEAMWWDLMTTTAMLHERIVSLGRRSAVERLGHLFCELYYRLSMVGMMSGTGFELPITQTDLADLLGLSPVHVNRSMQDLRTTGLIATFGRRIMIPDIEELQNASFFDTNFLHLKESR